LSLVLSDSVIAQYRCTWWLGARFARRPYTLKDSLQAIITWYCNGGLTYMHSIAHLPVVSIHCLVHGTKRKTKAQNFCGSAIDAYSTAIQWLGGTKHKIHSPYAFAAQREKMWRRRLRMNPFRFSPAGSILVNRSASLSCVLT
jgi:hypothetical protein